MSVLQVLVGYAVSAAARLALAGSVGTVSLRFGVANKIMATPKMILGKLSGSGASKISHTTYSARRDQKKGIFPKRVFP